MQENPLINSYKKELEKVISRLTVENIRESKDSLIDIQQRIKEANLAYDQRKDLLDIVQDGFFKIQQLRQDIQDAFESEAIGNYYEVIDEVKASVANAKITEDTRQAWDSLIELQQKLRDLKLLKNQREEIHQLMNEGFENIKSRRGQQQNEQEESSISSHLSLLEKAQIVVELSQHHPDIQHAKNEIFQLLEEVKSANLIKPHREQISKLIQDAFVWIDLRKDQEKESRQLASQQNANELKEQIQIGQQMVDEAVEFNPVWDFLKCTQLKIRSTDLLKEHRDVLFGEIQKVFENLKNKQDSFYNELHKEAIDNYKMLSEKVEKASKMAQSSLELKKAKDYVKAVQADFKGLKLKKEDREALYQKISKAYDTISNRIDTHIATKKETTRLRSDYQIGEFEYHINQIKEEIEKDLAMIKSLEERKETTHIEGVAHDEGAFGFQIGALKASIRNKENQISELLEKLNYLLEKKQTWEQIDESPEAL